MLEHAKIIAIFSEFSSSNKIKQEKCGTLSLQSEKSRRNAAFPTRLQEADTCGMSYLHDSGLHLGMPAHAEVVVATPDGDLLVLSAAFRRHRERRRTSADLLEDAVRVVVLLLRQLRIEETLVVKDSLRGRL